MPVVSSSWSSCLGLVLTTPTSCRLPSAKVVQVMGSSSTSSGCYEKRYINYINMKEKAEKNNSCLAGRREFAAAAVVLWLPAAAALAASDEEYVKETSDVIKKVRSTIGMDKTDPNVASAVAELRDASNSWVAKYRREKALLGRVSFRDMYSALNAVSGHYISFGPTAPIPAKRKARILEEVDTAEKALLRGR